MFDGNCYLKSGNCDDPVSYPADKAISGGAGFPGGDGWVTVSTKGVTPQGKDEAGYYLWNDALCMIGGRGTQSIDCYHPNNETWTRAGSTTDNLHHIQPVVWKGEVWIVAGWHGNWPDNEKDIKNVMIYNPSEDKVRTGPSIPTEFQRGGAGCVVYNDLIYVAQGASNGHLKQYGAKAFSGLSTFDPSTGEWKALTPPHYNRDHFDAAVIGTNLILASGRDTPKGCTGPSNPCPDDPSIFHWTVGPAEIYDFGSGKWRESKVNITSQRAGAMTIVDQNDQVLILGGESDTQTGNEAFTAVEAFDMAADTWTKLPSMNTGRHTGGAELYQHDGKVSLIAAIGVGKMGGSPQLQDTEQWVEPDVNIALV